MRPRYACLALTLLLAPTVLAQEMAPETDTLVAPDLPMYGDEAAAVRVVLARLFDGMRAGDSTAVASVFLPSATLGTTYVSPDGTPHYSESGVANFIQAVGSPHAQVWDERLWGVNIEVDGRMAVAWAPYAFFLDDAMSHCGVNSVQLFHGEAGWQIVRLMDTRHRAACAEFVPEAVMRAR